MTPSLIGGGSTLTVCAVEDRAGRRRGKRDCRRDLVDGDSDGNNGSDGTILGAIKGGGAPEMNPVVGGGDGPLKGVRGVGVGADDRPIKRKNCTLATPMSSVAGVWIWTIWRDEK